MRIETFVKRAMGKVDAASFLKEHRAFLCSFKAIVPILVLLEKKEIYPTPALGQILTLMALEKDPTEKTEEVVHPKTGEITVKSLTQVQTAAKKKEPKRYVLFLIRKGVYGGEQIDEETYDSADFGDAMRIANRVLFRNEDALYMDILGMGVTTRIGRDQAMRELLGRGPGGRVATKKTAKSSSGLGWRCSAKQFVAKFSRG